MANLGEMIEKIKADDGLKKQFAEAVKNKSVIAFLSAQGCDTTEAEINKFLSAKKTELSDEELDNVSGGCDNGVVVSLAGFGIGCAVSSIYNAIFSEDCFEG